MLQVSCIAVAAPEETAYSGYEMHLEDGEPVWLYDLVSPRCRGRPQTIDPRHAWGPCTFVREEAMYQNGDWGMMSWRLMELLTG